VNRFIFVRAIIGFVVSLGGMSCASEPASGAQDISRGEREADEQKAEQQEADEQEADEQAADGQEADGHRPNPSERVDAARKPGQSDAAIKANDAAARPVRDAGLATDASAMTTPEPRPEGYVNLAVEPGRPFDETKPETHPMPGYTPPTGWSWYGMAGSKCRDGSPFGVMVHWSASDSKNLFLYFEGGGACANPGFCAFNPADVNHQFSDKGQTALAATNLQNKAQEPGSQGIFNFAEAQNPYRDWNFVYIPYCTGDVHFGGNAEAKIEGVERTQNFSGAANSQAVIARAVATWPETARFVSGGSSAGGYGASLNFGMIQDTFAAARGSVIFDAAPPFSNQYAPSCLQKRWREAWSLDKNMPSDCGELCKTAEGGNLFNVWSYWRAKYPEARFALISGVHDEIIRLFMALGNDDCAGYQSYDPVLGFIGSLGQTYDPAKYKAGLLDIRTQYAPTGQLSTYYQEGLPNGTIHQCLFEPRVYTEAAGAGKGTIAEFLRKFDAETMSQVGP
jgi:hypothetical protein